MQRQFILTCLVALSFGLTACQGMDGIGTKQGVGALGGAALGGLAGSQIGGGKGQLIAVGAGTLLGALAGSEIGKSLDRADMMYAERATSRAYTAPIGQSVSWNNPQSGNYGTVTPVNDYTANNGSYCREYQQTIYVDGQAQTGNGRACRNADGTWQII